MSSRSVFFARALALVEGFSSSMESSSFFPPPKNPDLSGGGFGGDAGLLLLFPKKDFLAPDPS
jgi:hypothetical protein